MEKVASPSNPSAFTAPYRQDGAFVFHHPPKFLWERGVMPGRQVWKRYSIYLHFPFCRSICAFCTFERKILRPDSISKFLDLLWAEMDLVQQCDDFTDAEVESVYIGGGTASLLPHDAIARFLERLRAEFGLRGQVEVTLECAPGTMQAQDIERLLDIGVNRISIGVQAFQDGLLKRLGRPHSVRQSLEMIEAAHKAGVKNLHIDLMYGLPGQTLEDWQETVTRTVELNLQHISAYQLIVFSRERLDRAILHGDIAPTPSAQVINDMHVYLQDKLRAAGFERYSLTEFAQPGFECQYVRATWIGTDYMGMGPSAYSRNGLTLWENEVVHLAYERGIRNSTRPVGKCITMSPRECLERDIAMGLCMLEIDIPTIESRAGASIEQLAREIQELETEQFIRRTNGKIVLTERGIRYATHVMKLFTAG